MNNISHHRWDICIIGGGASGLAAAASAAMELEGKGASGRILVLEKRKKTGSKICASGNGRCNMSNEACPHVEETMGFFSRVGVLTRTDGEGRIYPYSEEASDVEKALRLAAENRGVVIVKDTQVTGLEKEEEGFSVTALRAVDGEKETGSISADQVLIATGGKSYSSLGTVGDGYPMAKRLGHRVLPLVPVLTAIEVKEDIRALAGVREKAKVCLYCGGRCVFSEEGEVQFTADSLSGICIFNMSRWLKLERGKKLRDGFDQYRIILDFLPDLTEKEAGEFIEAQEKRGLTGEDAMNSLVKAKLAKAVAEGWLSREPALRQLKGMKLSPKKPKGWEYAQVTRGGVDRDEVDMDTMESSLMSGLYFAGEILDYDGPCGGFNLNHAWITGIRAGKAMALRVMENHQRG